MKIYKLKDFTRGWIVGDFEPSVIRTKNSEFMVRRYKKGDKEPKHVHKIADEITVVIDGEFKMLDKKILPGDIVHLGPGDMTDFECVSDGVTAVWKSPSVIGDKFLIN